MFSNCSRNCLLTTRKCLWSMVIRSKTKSNVLKTQKKTNATDLAMQHFDNFYLKIYGNKWQSIRLGLLSPKKYVAIVNNFADHEAIEIELRQLGAYNLRIVYEKNLRSIMKRLQKDEFLRSRSEMKESNNESDSNPVSELELHSESESERIEHFFTDASETELEHNAASMTLDLNDFVPVSELKYNEEISNENDYFQFYDVNFELPIISEQQLSLEISPMLNLYTYRRNDFSTFPAAKICLGNLFNYYLIDGASALPVLIMDIKPGETVADLCAGPGGKSLMIYLIGRDSCRMFFNEISQSRYDRLRNVFNSFVPRTQQTNIMFSHADACQLRRYNEFDKILVDVPCTNDRHSLFVNENNIFSNQRLNERIQMPVKQMEILYEALNSVKVGGTVVYSTCSLSPIQNDGVVHMAMKQVLENTQMEFKCLDLKEALRPLRSLFRFDFNFKYGIQVLPNLCSNFGPMYFAKLVRIK